MHKIKETVVVEGVYDRHRIESFLSGVILSTCGFSVFTDEDMVKTIRTMAKETGIVILTDSDSAGMRIRNFLKQQVPENEVKHAYVPDIAGKERRKRKPSAEGLLGVEGMSEEVIIKALRDAGCTIDGENEAEERGDITKTDLYLLGLSGGRDSAKLRAKLSERLGIPTRLSANMLTEVLGRLVSRDVLVDIVQKIKEENI